MGVEARQAARSSPWAVAAALVLWVLIFVLAVGALVLILAVKWDTVPSALRPTSSSLAGAIPVEVGAAVGAVIAIRRPGNLMGWLLLGISLTAALLGAPGLYAAYAVYINPSLPGALWIYWFSQTTWLFLFGGLLVLLPLLFPDGRLLSRRWLIPIGLYGVLIVMGVLASLDPAATAPLPNPASVRALSGMNNLLSTAPFTVFFLGVCSTGLASVAVRYRRGGEQERQQLKWLLLAIIVLLVALVLQIFLPLFANSPLLPLAAALVPVAIGVAVLRYRLYDIDVILNKALVYGGLAVVITIAYVLVVVGIGTLVGQSRQLLLSLLTTAVIALAFQPLRHRAQQLANRLVYGKRATPYETLSQFSQHLSETFSQEDILDRMSRILAQGTGAQRAEVWVRAGSRLLLASSSPTSDSTSPREMRMDERSLPELGRDRVAPVSHGGELLGALAVVKRRGETMNAVEDKLVTDLAAQAGLVLKNVGLNRELLARLEDLRASRQRLVTAQDEERRRIERNIHDGAQQHLVALKVKVSVAESLSEPESRARPILSQLKRDADDAIENLRELARGIYPPLLASDGLGVALQAHLRRLSIPIELKVADIPRQPREVEAAVYFCCLEALQNVAKYAQALHVHLDIWADNFTLRFRVYDDGAGFDPATVARSSGLQNMRDRLEALGGSFTVESAPGKGTTIDGRLTLG